MEGDSDSSRKQVLNRLRRAQGQLAAVIRAVEEERPCREVVTQLSATSRALNRAGVVLVSSALQDCLADPGLAGTDAPAEYQKLFMMLA